jgi:hypothetical protein
MFNETMAKYDEEPIRREVIQFRTEEQVNWKIKFLYCLQQGA